MKKLFILLAAIIAVTTLVACGPVEIELGEYIEIEQLVTHVEIVDGEEKNTRVTVTEKVPLNAKVVASFSPEFDDIVLNIGVDKFEFDKFAVAKAGISYPSNLAFFQSKEFFTTGSIFGEDITDEFKAMIPDLVVIGGRSAAAYQDIKAIYPNVAVLDISNTNPYSFKVQKDVFELLGKVFTNVKEELTTEINKLDAIYNEIIASDRSKKVMFLMLNISSISMYGPGSRYGFIFDELGLQTADEDNTILDAHGKTISGEYISAVNPDVIILMDRNYATSRETSNLDLIYKNQLILDTTAGKNNEIYTLDSISWYINPGGIDSTTSIFNDVLKVLS